MDVALRLKSYRRSNQPRYTLIVGDDEHLSVLMAMATKLGWGQSCLRFKSLGEAREFVRDHEIERIIATERVEGGAPIVDRSGRDVPVVPAFDVFRRSMGRLSLAGIDTANLEKAVRRPRPVYSFAKRAVDIGVAVAALLVLAVPALLAALAIRVLRGAWPTLAKPAVVGQNGEVFQLLKMTPGGDSSEHSIGMLRARHYLHVTGLEFLPSLALVLIGRLSLVGPKPATVEAVNAGSHLSEAYALRTLVRPGLVGLPQVRSFILNEGRDALIALEYDLYYLAHRSMWLDIRILGRGVFILVKSWIRFAIGVGRGMARRFAVTYRRMNRRVGPARLASVPLPLQPNGAPRAVEPCIVVGAGAGGRLLLRELKGRSSSRYWPVAIVDDDLSLFGQRIENVPVVGSIDTLAAVAEREHVGTVVIAIPSASERVTQRISQIAQTSRLRIMTMPSISSIIQGENALRLRPVETRDLLGRPVVETDALRAKAFMAGKRVLVTGAAGSIGSEVVRQAMRGEPAVIIGLDNNESGLFDLQQELRVRFPEREFIPIVASIVDEARIDQLMTRFSPQIVFHAAAYKHVPLMEEFPYEAIVTNINGTSVMTSAARRHKVERFVMVSTDKAVRPSSVMGASKRIAELIVREATLDGTLSACSVRFGNVLGSRGSVIPLFEKQIAEGGPVTVTDPGMTRYFMTIPEAAGLIIEAGAFGDRGVTYMLDMGEPVRILDIAERLIRMHNKEPGVDIDIIFTGLRPGEKLFEELALDFESARETAHPKVRILDEARLGERIPMSQLLPRLTEMSHGRADEIRAAILQVVQDVDGVNRPNQESNQEPAKTSAA